MRIPVFVSCASTVNRGQESSRKLVLNQLQRFGLECRALGRSDYPTDCPLKEVLLIARHCAGGVILGFEQFHTSLGTWKRGTKDSKKAKGDISFPTPWNHLEAGILFSLNLPVLVFKEPNISGGVFDNGVSDVFIHKMPQPPLTTSEKTSFEDVFLKWQANVRKHYYSV
jgi:hypothetical protein